MKYNTNLWEIIGAAYKHIFTDLNVEFKVDLLPINSRGRSGIKMTPSSITIHNTANANKGANAQANVNYFKNAPKSVSAHIVIDDKTAILCIPLYEVAWHAGDGLTGKGNNTSIGIEICENADGNYRRAEEIAAHISSLLCVYLGIKTVVPHKHWSGKNCPHIILNEGRMQKYQDNIIQRAAINRDNWEIIFNKLKNGEPLELNAYEVEKLKAKQWVIDNGISDGSNPENELTRQDAWIMLMRLAQSNDIKIIK